MKLHAAIARWLEKYDLLLYGALFLAVLLLRLSTLQAAPLNEKEAAEAWGAWRLLRGGAPGSSALYAAFTACLFFLGGPVDWLARLLPALAGSALVFLPLVLRPSRGKLEAALLALLIAFSPAVTAISAQAGGAACGVLAAALWIFHSRNARKDASPSAHNLVGGLLLGLTLASGPVGWSGIAIALLCLAADWLIRQRRTGTGNLVPDPWRASLAEQIQSGSGLAGLSLGLVLGGTGMLFFPRAIGALATGMTDWLGAFFSGLPPVGETILLLTAYEPIALVFGVAGIILAVRSVPDVEDRFLLTFAAVAAVWALLRPAAFPEETIWILLPLLLFAARALRRVLEASDSEFRPQIIPVQMIIVLILMLFAVFSLAQYAALGGLWRPALALLAFVASLIAGPLFIEKWASAWRESLVGFAFAWFILLLIVQAGAGINLAQSRRASANELWWPQIVPLDLIRLRKTMEDLSNRQTGVADELPVVMQGTQESALGWALLGYGAAEFSANTGRVDVAPAVVIAPLTGPEEQPALPQMPADYRGQVFAVGETRAWDVFPPDLISWWFYREGPVTREKIILWVRTDLFGASEEAAP